MRSRGLGRANHYVDLEDYELMDFGGQFRSGVGLLGVGIVNENKYVKNETRFWLEVPSMAERTAIDNFVAELRRARLERISRNARVVTRAIERMNG